MPRLHNCCWRPLLTLLLPIILLLAEHVRTVLYRCELDRGDNVPVILSHVDLTTVLIWLVFGREDGFTYGLRPV